MIWSAFEWLVVAIEIVLTMCVAGIGIGLVVVILKELFHALRR